MPFEPEIFWNRVREIAQRYSDTALIELRERWNAWPIDPNQIDVHEVIGGLLARQTTLAIEFVGGPPMWTPHLAPLVLRAMVDVRISLGWILKDASPRAKLFVAHGLGQVKLQVEHLKARLAAEGSNAEEHPMVKAMIAWIDGQRFHFLTEVNVGNWGNVDVRTMAHECGCEELYSRDYATWSGAGHSQWHHIHPYNLKPCTNPLHRGGHRVPRVSAFPSDLTYPHRAVDYLADTLSAFDEFRGQGPTCGSAQKAFEDDFDRLADDIEAAKASDSDAPAPDFR